MNNKGKKRPNTLEMSPDVPIVYRRVRHLCGAIPARVFWAVLEKNPAVLRRVVKMVLASEHGQQELSEVTSSGKSLSPRFHKLMRDT
jgi:hypothetical protein